MPAPSLSASREASVHGAAFNAIEIQLFGIRRKCVEHSDIARVLVLAARLRIILKSLLLMMIY